MDNNDNTYNDLMEKLSLLDVALTEFKGTFNINQKLVEEYVTRKTIEGEFESMKIIQRLLFDTLADKRKDFKRLFILLVIFICGFVGLNGLWLWKFM